MKKSVKKIINKLGFRLVNINSKDLVQNSYVTPLANFFQILKEFGFEPKHIVDVGANHGKWTRSALKFFPNASITMVEPQYWLKESIQDVLDANPNVKLHSYGAGEAEGSFTFTVADEDVSSSFNYSAAEAKERGYKQLELPIITLNKLLAESNLPTPDLIKIDAEGIDIQVLKGASNYLGKTEIIMVEASVLNKSYNNSLLETINFMDKNGYTLFDITEINRPFRTKVLWLVELVFVLKGGTIDSQVIEEKY
ncbi:FkbM family methyltransferase [Flavobacterium sp. 25HG05S-40]|uniref:FkbM family methyltransferase n=1 Tax=Flavobacterium sp. 25HG05S-40 TaxID=3458682 RepID=UPI0040441666